MNTFKNLCVAFTLALGAMASFDNRVAAQPAGYEFYGHYHDYASASRVVAAINGGHDGRYDAGWAETSPHPVTRTFGVYARPRAGNGADNSAHNHPGWVQNGNLTKGHALDRDRRGSHAVVYNVNLEAGRRYQIDLTSPQGAAHFDTWLRVENAQGGVLANDDDSGAGLDARVVLNAPYTGTYRLVVTSFRAGATGSYTLAVR